MFKTQQGPFSVITDIVDRKVSDEINEDLKRSFTVEEIKYVVFSMHPDKALGPDGLNPGFFQHFWSTVGDDVSKAIMECLNNKSPVPGSNNTNIVLIPKKKQPEFVSDLRPISLCNVVDRITCEVLANRMKRCMNLIISEVQSTFILGRYITDNAMISFEAIHYLKRKTQGKVGYAALKTDMSKAYDRVEWGFLKAMMIKMGFCLEWVNKVMQMVTTVT
ncbi:hypothetical protein KY290_010457 [Solanum tuberosum]|uniref:Reverse transcriptase domain-containing protein n=1 Tax=Solanum tuberosum TaxID=4113 RepID=A0ABQ7VXV5_SOLTU|nr:hypothetical protein KY285_010351 [Solanum tuberosum]KAH0773320.1 hypothetical protein KY290_010457 [Solanum tuberosum]